MHNVYPLGSEIYWIGVNDRRIDLFENHFPVLDGVSYNSYFIDDEETAVLDTADNSVLTQYFSNLEYVLKGRPLNYLIVQHMEPDHCAVLAHLAHKYPETKIVVNERTACFIKQFFPEGVDWDSRFLLVTNGQRLKVGKRELTFVFAPMVHWPEVMVTYDATHRVLFSADAFGSFGALSGNITNERADVRSRIAEYRRYYTNIVGKYGFQTSKLLGIAAGLDFKMICPLHGLVLCRDFDYLIGKYQKWATYQPEERAVMIAFASMYHHTENAAEVLARYLDAEGVEEIALYDVSRLSQSHLVAEAFRCSHIVLAAPTYMNELYPEMEHFLHALRSRGVAGRQLALIGNGSWAPQAVKVMSGLVASLPRTKLLGVVEFMSSLNEAKERELQGLAQRIAASLRED